MALKDELATDVQAILGYKWPVTLARIVPEPGDIALGDAAKLLEGAVVFYADLDGSTTMVDTKKWWFSAEVYKSFLFCAAKLIRAANGVITAYDGDRIMAIFIGDDRCDRAVRTALRLHWATRTLITPALQKRYPDDNFSLRHNVGIDMSDLHAVRTGVRGGNDLVWVGRAANYAAKLTALSADFPTRLTKRVYESLSAGLRVAADGRSIWESRQWTDMNNHPIYRSNWWQPL